MKKVRDCFIFSVIVLFFYGFFFSTDLKGEEWKLLHFKPLGADLNYELTINTASQLEANYRTQIIRKHQDIMDVNVQLKNTEDGLLDMVLRVDKINPTKYLGYQGGSQWKREQIVGNSQHTKMDILGRVAEATGIPHFSSGLFYGGSEDSPPLDIYRVLLMISPKFPLKMVSKGGSWTAEEEIILREAPALSDAGIAERSYELEMKVKVKSTYTLVDYVQKDGYNTALIKMEANFRTDGSASDPTGGYYKKGNGKVTGEYYFAPDEGIIVEASMKSKFNETNAEDGPTVRYWLNPQTFIFLNLEDRTTVPLLWHVDQDVHFKIKPGEKAQGNKGENPEKLSANNDLKRAYNEERWVFDILNGNFRFSHGNHRNRDRWFKVYFGGKGFECGICHNSSLPEAYGGGVRLSEGEPYSTAEEIREAIDDIYPYGVKMLTCLSTCHNDVVAPKECAWCHLPGSKVVKEGVTEITQW